MAKHKFNVGDWVRWNETQYEIMEISDDGYHCDNAFIPFSQEYEMQISVNFAPNHKCCKCGKQAYAWFDVFSPNIPAYPYCKECLDKAKQEFFKKLCEADK